MAFLRFSLLRADMPEDYVHLIAHRIRDVIVENAKSNTNLTSLSLRFDGKNKRDFCCACSTCKKKESKFELHLQFG